MLLQAPQDGVIFGFDCLAVLLDLRKRSAHLV